MLVLTYQGMHQYLAAQGIHILGTKFWGTSCSKWSSNFI